MRYVAIAFIIFTVLFGMLEAFAHNPWHAVGCGLAIALWINLLLEHEVAR